MGSERTNGTALDTVIIFTHQMEAMVRFYKDGLGLGPFESSPGHCGCYCGAVYFGFDQIDEHNEPRNRPSCHGLLLKIFRECVLISLN
jgi:hypothetical protein